MREAEQGKTLPRIGLVATGEVRIAGIRAILAGDGRDVVLLTDHHLLETAGLPLVMIDAATAADVFGLVGSFRRMRPWVRLILFDGPADDGFMEAAIRTGVSGVLAADAGERAIGRAIAAALEGEVWAPRRVLARLLEPPEQEASAGAGVHLTTRELAVLRLLAQGFSNREMASALGVERATIKAHLGRLMRKAGVESRTGLGVRAIEQRWI